jgi:lactoylglutathione lyase
MRLTHVRLLTTDHPGTLAFYRDLLGLRVTLEVDGVYAELAAGDAILALYRRDLMQQVVAEGADGSRAVLTFEVDDVDATYASLRSKGVEFVNEPHDQEAWYLRVVHLKDPDGNVIEINHSIASS